MRFTYEIEGMRELEKLFKALPKNVSNRVTQKATTQTAKAIYLPALIAAAPFDTGKRSPDSRFYGALKTNIEVERLRKSKSKTRKGARVWTGESFWGYFYEMGTSRQPPRPWFVPTISRIREAGYMDLKDRLLSGITNEWVKR